MGKTADDRAALDTFAKELGAAKTGPQAPVQEPEKPPQREPPISAIDLMQKEFDPLYEPVRGLVGEGATMLVGSPKVGKSWLVLLMAVNMANGEPFLGRETTRSKVLYLALEDSQRRLQSRLAALDTGQIPANLFLRIDAPTMGAGLEDMLDKWFKETGEPSVVIIDTLQKVRGATRKSTNAYEEDYSVLGILKRIADKYKSCIILVHHTNKSKDTTDPYDRVSGSTGITGSADTTILITRDRDKDTATVQYVGRDVFGDAFVIRLDNGRWVVVSNNANEYSAANRYAGHPLVQLFRLLIAENPKGGRWTYEKLKAKGLELLGYQPFIDSKECVRQLSDGLATEMRKRDNLLVECGIQTTGGRGIRLQEIQPVRNFQVYMGVGTDGSDGQDD